jgi:uncharacterized membrane protein YgaE (UPF0421/DUF939 family)
MNYQIIYLDSPEADSVTIKTIIAASIGAAVSKFINDFGIVEAQILAVILVNE